MAAECLELKLLIDISSKIQKNHIDLMVIMESLNEKFLFLLYLRFCVLWNLKQLCIFYSHFIKKRSCINSKWIYHWITPNSATFRLKISYNLVICFGFFSWIVGSKGLNEKCERVQCNKTTTAGVYGENRTCTCDKVQEEGVSGMYSSNGRKILKVFLRQ